MKHLMRYNESSMDDDSFINRLTKSFDDYTERVNTINIDLPIFIEKISELIDINYSIYDIDSDMINNILDKYLIGSDLYNKKQSIEMVDKYKTPKTNTEVVSSKILNFGYSIGAFASIMGNSVDIDYSKFIDDIINGLHFSKESNNRIEYNGPDIISSCILATTPNIKIQIGDIKQRVKRYLNNDQEFGELKVIIGCIYQYGYALGNDTQYVNNLEQNINMIKIRSLFKK